MTLVLDLPSDVEARLDAQAAEMGMAPSEYALQILQAGLPAEMIAQQPSESEELSENPTVALLRRWEEEDATDDPEEIRKAEVELEELKEARNANRRAGGMRLLFP